MTLALNINCMIQYSPFSDVWTLDSTLSNCRTKVVPSWADDERYTKQRKLCVTFRGQGPRRKFVCKTQKGRLWKLSQSWHNLDFFKKTLKRGVCGVGRRAFCNCHLSMLWATANPPEVTPPCRNVLVQARADLLVRHVLSQDEINIKIKLKRGEGQSKAAISNVFCPPVGVLLC